MKHNTINARVGEKTAHQVDYLKEELNIDRTAVIVKALDLLYRSVEEQKAKPSPFEAFDDLGLIGCFEGDADLSENYKTEIADSLNKKYS